MKSHQHLKDVGLTEFIVNVIPSDFTIRLYFESRERYTESFKGYTANEVVLEVKRKIKNSVFTFIYRYDLKFKNVAFMYGSSDVDSGKIKLYFAQTSNCEYWNEKFNKNPNLHYLEFVKKIDLLQVKNGIFSGYEDLGNLFLSCFPKV